IVAGGEGLCEFATDHHLAVSAYDNYCARRQMFEGLSLIHGSWFARVRARTQPVSAAEAVFSTPACRADGMWVNLVRCAALPAQTVGVVFRPVVCTEHVFLGRVLRL